MQRRNRWLIALLVLLLLAACTPEENGAKPEDFTAPSETMNATLPLQNGVPVTNLSGARYSQTFFSISVPQGASNLRISISGGSGDADLYVKFGSEPTTRSYDCRPYRGGNDETCSSSNPRAGTYYVMLRGYRSYSGVTLLASYSGGDTSGGSNQLENGVPVTNLSGAKGSATSFTLDVPNGARNLHISIAGGSGDADLYVKFGSAPTTTSYDCRPYLNGNDETCAFSTPRAGTYYVTLRGYSSYAGVSLVGRYETSSTPPSGSFDIQFVFGPNVTSSQKALFEQAAARWEQVIVGDLADVTIDKSANLCGQNEPAYSGVVDDVVIYAEVGPRDGPGGILASAGPCLIRSGGLTSYGVMNFDSADSSGPDLYETILHEMGHVLGIGTLWTRFGLVNYGSSCPTTPRYSGQSARSEWHALGGSGDIPVEQDGGAGTRCGHWDENTFDTELMTGYSEGSASEPLSRMTIGSLEDMGYGVNKSAADPYSLPACSPNCLLAPRMTSDFAPREILLSPVGVSLPDGRIELFKPER